MSAIAIDKQSALVLSAATTPKNAVNLDQMTTAATQPDSRVAHPDVIVPGSCREAAGPL